MALPGADASTTIRTVHSHVHALGQCRKVIREHGLTPVISGDTAGAAREVAEPGDPTQAAISPPLAAEIYGLEVLRRRRRGRGPQHHPLRGALPRAASRRRAGNGPVVTTLHLQRPQPAGRALQGARRLRHQRRQHDQAGELHGRRRVHRDPVPRRGRRPPRRPRAAQRARGAGVLHHRREDPRRLSRRRLPGRRFRPVDAADPRTSASRASTSTARRAPATPRSCTAPARPPTRSSRSCGPCTSKHPERAVLATRLAAGGARRRRRARCRRPTSTWSPGPPPSARCRPHAAPSPSSAPAPPTPRSPPRPR